MNKYERWTKIVRKVDHSEWDCQLKKTKTKKLLTVRVGLFSLREKAPTKKQRITDHKCGRKITKKIVQNVTASSGTAISTDFATLTCSEILSKILIRCVTWHWACDCSFRCFHEIARYFDNKEQERAKTRARRHDRSQRRQEHPKIDSFWGANSGFIDFQHYPTLCSGNRKNESFRLKILVWCLEPLRPSFLAVWFAIFVPVFMYFQWFWLYSVALALV